MRKALAVGRKEFRQIARDKRTLMILLFVPAFFLLLYGYALNWDIRHVRLAVEDRDHSPESRSVIAAFGNSGYFDLVASADASGIASLMDRNEVRAVLVMPEDLGRSLQSGRSVAVQVLLNGDNANTATTVMGYALTILRSESARYLPGAGEAAAPLLSVEPRVWYNPQLRSTVFLVPGLIAYIAMITAVVSTALSIVREKERGTMEQVRMAPLDAFPFVVGKTIPYFVVSLISAMGIILVAMVLFDLPMRGSWLLLVMAMSLFLVVALGIGLLISSIADSQQVAFQMAMLLSFLPTLMLSGFIFPISSMPAFLQLITYTVPARYFLIVLRGIVLKGTGVESFWVELAALSISAALVLALASVRLREAVDIMKRVAFLIWKELIELREDPWLFRVVIVAPILQLMMLGYAATTDVRHVPIVVADADRSAASRELISRFSASPNFTITAIVTGTGEINPYLERGRAWMALAIPAGYGERIEAGRPETVQVVADGSDANSTTVALGYATNLIAGYAQELVARRGAGGAPAAWGIDPRVRVWFNSRLESRHFMIPGVLAMLLLVVTTNLSSMGIVREKEIGTLEQLNVTPLRRWELIVGKLLPYALIGMIDVFLVIAVATLWFDVPLRGSLVLLIGLTLVYLLTTLGLGLFVSTISSTQQQAMMTTTFFFLMPMIYLSGFVFPIENMPQAIQWITYVIPLRYFLVIVRSIFLKGVGLETFWPQVLALTAWGVAILALAIARSTKRLA